MKLAVALSYATPESIRYARMHWLRVPHVAAGNSTVPSCNIVYVPPQAEVSGSSYDRYNHPTDNRMLHVVRLANVSFPEVDWLLVGDGDTCFQLAKVEHALRRFDPNVSHLIGTSHSKPPEAARGTIPRAPAWPYGGDGFAVSRRLLDRISSSAWKFCEDDLRSFGADVRVASCIFYHLRQVVKSTRHPLGLHRGCLLKPQRMQNKGVRSCVAVTHDLVTVGDGH